MGRAGHWPNILSSFCSLWKEWNEKNCSVYCGQPCKKNTKGCKNSQTKFTVFWRHWLAKRRISFPGSFLRAQKWTKDRVPGPRLLSEMRHHSKLCEKCQQRSETMESSGDLLFLAFCASFLCCGDKNKLPPIRRKYCASLYLVSSAPSEKLPRLYLTARAEYLSSTITRLSIGSDVQITNTSNENIYLSPSCEWSLKRGKRRKHQAKQTPRASFFAFYFAVY